MEKLKMRQILSLTFTLFAIFFGAGNMIFPPAMGQVAGEHYLQALAGFILTDAGIALLGIIAVVLVGNKIMDLGDLVSRRFSLCLSITVYLLIGPLFALPRTGSVSYELAVRSYVPQEYEWLASLLVTAVFFALTYYLSGNPGKVVDIIGKYMTPILIVSIVLLYLACLFLDKSQHALQYGAIGQAQGEYREIAFFKGMIEGYNALDGPAGPVFAIIIIHAITGFQVKERKNVVKYTVISGIGAVLILSIIYYMLTYIGATTHTIFENGGALLHGVASDLLGPVGGLVLGASVFLACMTTSIGLTTSFADYFHELLPSVSYRKITAAVCLFSFAVSNVGLSYLIAVSQPVLMMIYPELIVLILLSFVRKWIGDRKMVYILSMIGAFCFAFLNAMDNIGITFGLFTEWARKLPLYELHLGWMLPAVCGAVTGFLPIWKKHRKPSMDRNKINLVDCCAKNE